jgi:lysophosphatidylcholine acyltransferase/lyso-PAF acetyltransferase
VQLALHSRSPGYVAKDLVRKVPGIGYVAEVILQSLFVKRTSSDDKQKVFSQILERQQNVIKGEAAPIQIFPEGCTTNGDGVINFKKGAFASLLPV